MLGNLFLDSFDDSIPFGGFELRRAGQTQDRLDQSLGDRQRCLMEAREGLLAMGGNRVVHLGFHPGLGEALLEPVAACFE